MQLRLVIFASDGRGARNLDLGPGTIALAAIITVSAIAGVLWVGWKLGELTASL